MAYDYNLHARHNRNMATPAPRTWYLLLLACLCLSASLCRKGPGPRQPDLRVFMMIRAHDQSYYPRLQSCRVTWAVPTLHTPSGKTCLRPRHPCTVDSLLICTSGQHYISSYNSESAWIWSTGIFCSPFFSSYLSAYSTPQTRTHERLQLGALPSPLGLTFFALFMHSPPGKPGGEGVSVVR